MQPSDIDQMPIQKGRKEYEKEHCMDFDRYHDAGASDRLRQQIREIRHGVRQEERKAHRRHYRLRADGLQGRKRRVDRLRRRVCPDVRQGAGRGLRVLRHRRLGSEVLRAGFQEHRRHLERHDHHRRGDPEHQLLQPLRGQRAGGHHEGRRGWQLHKHRQPERPDIRRGERLRR